MGVVLVALLVVVLDDEDSWRATHADDGEACAASSDFEMHLSVAPLLLVAAVSSLESVAEAEGDALVLAAVAWLGLHMVVLV